MSWKESSAARRSSGFPQVLSMRQRASLINQILKKRLVLQPHL